MKSLETESCIRGFHIYSKIWSPLIGKQIKRTTKDDNSRDDYAVAVVKTTPVSIEQQSMFPDAYQQCTLHSFEEVEKFAAL